MIEFILIALVVVGLLLNSVRKPSNYPPGPVGLPFLGFFHRLNQKYPQETFDNLNQKYGPCVGFYLGKFKVVLVGGWQAVNEAYANEDLTGRPDICLIRDRFNGENHGVIFTDGDNWKTQRRFCLHHFRNLGFGRKGHEAFIHEETEQLNQLLLETKGKPFHFEEFITITVINFIWVLLAGKRFNHKEEEIQMLVERIKETMHDIQMFGSIATAFPFIRYIFPKQTGYSSIKNGSKVLLEFVQKFVREHELTRDPDNPRDFIDLYLNELQKSEVHNSFTEIQLSAMCIDLVCAGADTSTCVLSFTILYLCLRKDLQTKIYEEVMEHVGPNRLPSFEDKTNLVYTEALLMEVLRMRTPIPTALPHRAIKDTSIMGYNIPKDTFVAININSVFMDKQYWGDPETFRPERFITPEGKLRRDDRFIAFGKGKRNCIGETLSKSSSFILLASLVKNFTFSFDPNLPIPPTEGIPGFTMSAPFFKVIATPRSQ